MSSDEGGTGDPAPKLATGRPFKSTRIPAAGVTPFSSPNLFISGVGLGGKIR